MQRMNLPCIYLDAYDRKNGSGRNQARKFFARYLSLESGQIVYAEASSGKPFLQNCPDLHIGISHSNGLLAAYIGPVAAGIDMEYIRPGRNFTGIAEDYFTDDERNEFRGTGSDTEKDALFRFYRIWTGKEAALKLSGEGLSGLVHARNAVDVERRHWLVGDRYLMCLAGSAGILASVRIETEWNQERGGFDVVPL